ncbi:MAG: helix-turn-helix domain-containing protein [Pseudobdellovibrionaceae bacterium]
MAKNIISGRKKLGLDAIKFAERAKVPYPTMRDIEADISGGSKKTKAKIATALGINIWELELPPKEPLEPAPAETEPPESLILKELKEIKAKVNEPQAPAVNPQDAEELAKWRAFEARIKLGGEDLLPKLLRAGEAELDFVREALGLPDRPHFAEAKRRAYEKKKAKLLRQAHHESASELQSPANPGRTKKVSR